MSLHVVGITEKDEDVVLFRDMRPGQYAKIVDTVNDNAYFGQIVFCQWDRTIVSLNSGATWNSSVKMMVKVVRPGSIINITVVEF